MLGTGSMIEYDTRPVDYVYNFRADQDIPLEEEVYQWRMPMKKKEDI